MDNVKNTTTNEDNAINDENGDKNNSPMTVSDAFQVEIDEDEPSEQWSGNHHITPKVHEEGETITFRISHVEMSSIGVGAVGDYQG